MNCCSFVAVSVAEWVFSSKTVAVLLHLILRKCVENVTEN